MDDTEFLLSKIDGALTRVSDAGLISYASSTILGLTAILLAISSLLPTEILNEDRVSLMLFAVGILAILVTMLGFLTNQRGSKQHLLRRLQFDVYDSKPNTLLSKQLDSLAHIIDSIEDEKKPYGSSTCDRIESNFKSKLKTQSTVDTSNERVGVGGASEKPSEVAQDNSGNSK